MDYLNSTTGEYVCQEDIVKYMLIDGTRKWHIRKAEQMRMANIIRCYNPEKALKLDECGTYLKFSKKLDGSIKLKMANFCRIRLCPICTWRRSLKLGLQMNTNYDIQVKRGYQFIFMTLTCKNCPVEDLNGRLTEIVKATDRLHKTLEFNNSVIGFMRAIEVTYNERQNSFHPHLHYILTVPSDYFDFTGKYLSTDKIKTMWAKAMRIEYLPVVDIRRVFAQDSTTGSMTKAVAETAKYPLKTTNILTLKSRKKQVEICKAIDEALKGRRLVSFGGVTREIRKELQQTDVEDNLVDLSDEDKLEAPELEEHIYTWRNGIYIPIELEAFKLE